MPSLVLDASTYLDLSPKECGREVTIAAKHTQFTPKDYALLHYVYSGKGKFYIRGKEYKLEAGDCFYIPAKEQVDYFPDPENPWSYFWLGLSGSRVDLLLEEAGLSPLRPVIHDARHGFKTHFGAIYESYFHHGGFGLDCLAHCYSLFFEMASDHSPKTPTAPSEKGHIQAAKAYIRNNYQFPITINDVAHSVGVSPNYLANLFAKEGEPSPKQYLIRVRLETAASLLLTTPASVAEIAKTVGYPTAMHFSKSFSAFYGVSPLHYRNKGEQK
ncbi:MAG: AraC family transcriptional regulator [Erysipelotrichaceae bacterium]|nr:AraC family transcriptional regulator [Erysipelotrichaceae bacterium]